VGIIAVRSSVITENVARLVGSQRTEDLDRRPTSRAGRTSQSSARPPINFSLRERSPVVQPGADIRPEVFLKVLVAQSREEISNIHLCH
jgi:hypothetical protein